MPQSAVSDQVRTSVHALRSEVGGQTAEATALAMVAGAAQGFLDITADEKRQATLRLLSALALNLESTLSLLAN